MIEEWLKKNKPSAKFEDEILPKHIVSTKGHMKWGGEGIGGSYQWS